MAVRLPSQGSFVIHLPILGSIPCAKVDETGFLWEFLCAEAIGVGYLIALYRKYIAVSIIGILLHYLNLSYQGANNANISCFQIELT